MAGSLLGQYKQPNGGLLGLAAGMLAVMATSSLGSQVLWGTRLGAGPSLAWAGVGALSVGLIWRYQVCMPVVRLALSTLPHLHMHILCVMDLNHGAIRTLNCKTRVKYARCLCGRHKVLTLL